jgi:broad specificity phosphatase PhoE
MAAAMTAIQRRFGHRVTAVVGHGLTLSLLRAACLGQTHVRFEDWARLSFGAVAAVELPEGKWVQGFPLDASSPRG